MSIINFKLLKKTMKKFGCFSLIVAIFIAATTVGINFVKIVPPGFIGILETMGVVDEEPHSNGPVWVWPLFTKLTLLDVREKTSELAVPARLSNGVNLTINGALNYKLVKDNAPDLYLEVGADCNRIDSVLVLPLLKGAINFTVGERSAEFVICQRRMVRDAIAYIIEDQWSKNNWLELTDLQLFNPGFDESIEQAYLNRAKVEIETKKIEEEAKQLIIKSVAEAESIGLLSKAEAEAIMRKSKALKNPMITRYLAAEALKKNWRGDVPQTLVIGADAAALVGGK